jgi:integrase
VGSVFRPFVTRLLPPGAQLAERAGKQVAIWTNSAGKKCQAPVTDTHPARIRVRAATYVAQYRDGSGLRQRAATGCKSRDAALAVLADLQRRAEQIRSGVLTATEATIADHADTPIAEHIDAYISHLTAKRGRGGRPKTSEGHVQNVRRDLTTAAVECKFGRLRDLNREAVDAWVARLRHLPDAPETDEEGNILVPRRPAPRTINAKLGSLTAWGNWLVDSRRLVSNPFTRLAKTAGIDAGDDIRRQRRALTEAELLRLLAVARLRPVAEYGRGTIRRDDKPTEKSSRATWKRADLTFETIATAAERGRTRVRPEVLSQLEQSGWERALLYLVLVTTGLRKGELSSLTVADVDLDDEHPAITLAAANAKNGREARLPLRSDVAAELLAWITQRQNRRVERSATKDRLFYVPNKLVRILYRDLKAAGIPKRDRRGRIVDVHAFRGTFGTHLARAGVDPVTLKTLTRHGRIETTLKSYIDDYLLETEQAVARLPAFSAGSAITGPSTPSGTPVAGAVAPDVAPTPGRTRPPVSVSGHFADGDDCGVVDANALPAADSAANAGEKKGWLTGLEPATPRITI